MFKELLEELAKIREEVTEKVNDVKNLQQEVNRLTEENEALKEETDALEQEITNLKQQIADHVCPTCNHEEEIEVLKAQVSSIQTEKEEQSKQYEENVLSLQAEIERLKKILATN